MPSALAILERLISFETVSRTSNLALLDYVEALLSAAGIASERIYSEDGSRANLHASVGPAEREGVLLSGHTDVVPVAGQAWSKPPFRLTAEGGRYYGRGTADMKGFVACAVSAMLAAKERPLALPLQLALSYDEEIGCLGVRSLIADLQQRALRPRFCIVGEPTELAVAIGHKGKLALRADCHGKAAHSALPSQGCNAIDLAAALIVALRSLQREICRRHPHDAAYAEPTTTIHVGTIAGGQALNIVPAHCSLDFEIRNLAQDDPRQILQRIEAAAERVSAEARQRFPAAGIAIAELASYPALDTPEEAAVTAFVKGLTGANATTKVAFGTEAGLFSREAEIPTVVCGPGSMAQGHKPDEFVTAEQIARCEAMLARLIDRLCTG